MELYIHIPFCVRKCAYCDFLSFAGKESCMEKYVDALIRDIGQGGGLPLFDRKLTSVYIGGGTPSLMPQGTYQRILDAVRENFAISENAEISIECNPGTVTIEKLLEYRNAGINRISFGAQSADGKELRLLGRIHTWEQVDESVRLARAAGFDNINIDLMMNLPGQTKEHFTNTVKKALKLQPEHISAYSLIIEEGTPFFEAYDAHPELLPDEESASDTYERAVMLLAEEGYRQYEISNFAKPGYECRHNIGYWRRAEYLGVGIGAASLISGVRYRVSDDLERYLEELTYEPEETLSDTDVRNETVMLGLRMNEGLSIAELARLFGDAYAKKFADAMDRYVSQGLAYSGDGRYGLTVRGMLVSNTMIASLME
ncbi:MAG: radical SAM family heme chaperone HemW [Lachnospiraceae bacterium]|nr:radical SAM family heme chaperone HemW [Lachnospiraceae bacterium]